MKGALSDDQRRHRIDILRALSHCANNIIADMEEKMKFWMVVREGQSSTNQKHTEYIVAEAEATRLAEKEKARFYILEAIEYVEPQPMPVIKVKL